jgi:GNAT superfamily N-acetyltransferase
MLRPMRPAPSDLAIALAESDADIIASLPAMQGLHPQWTDAAAYLAQIRTMMAGGYRLALLRRDGAVVACAGFHFAEGLSRGRFLHIDDLATRPELRAQGLGKALFGWLVGLARREGCARIDLDSRVTRGEAHRFYFRQGMTVASFHFVLPIA